MSESIENIPTEPSSTSPSSPWWSRLKIASLSHGIISVFLVLILFSLIIMGKNSCKPGTFEVTPISGEKAGRNFVTVNIHLIQNCLDEGWLINDKFSPTIFLDNKPNFQLGVLETVRYNVRNLRENLSRLRSTDSIDKYAAEAVNLFANDPAQWLLPSAESKYDAGTKKLQAYLDSLNQAKSQFYPRADNLIQLLEDYVSLMGGANTRLINAPPDIAYTIGLDTPGESNTAGIAYHEVRIPWLKIDDNFYYAQGIAYALRHSFEAIRLDFAKVIKDKNADELILRIIESLQRCYFEPILVLNGGPADMRANHSLNLAGPFNDARQKTNSLISTLTKG
jgi:hypothetical protein